jgi:transketolase
MRDVFVRRLSELAGENERIFLITGDLGFGVLDRFAADHPRQFLNAGVAEQNMTGLATGLALDGRIVFTYSIGNFPTLRCLEQIRNDAAYHQANVKVVAIGGGFSYGALGMSHHATEDLAILRAVPGVTVVAPGDDWETESAVAALVAAPGTAYLRLDKSTAGWTRQGEEQFELGKARTLREGLDLTVAVCGGILGSVLAAADRVSAEGIHCRVLSVHTIRPLDIDALSRAARETGGILTVEEHSVDGGLGGAVAEALLESAVRPTAFHRLGVRGSPSAVVGSQDYLRKVHGLSVEAIIERIRGMVAGKSGS